MTVRDIAMSAASILQADDIAEALGGSDGTEVSSLDADAQTLIKCVNLAKNEISNEFPVIVTTEADAINGLIPMSALDNASCVKGVTDMHGGTIAFTADSRGIKVSHDGRYTVAYARLPYDAEIDEQVIFGSGIDADTAAYLTARYYCIITGRTDEAAVWDQLYNNAAESKRICRRAAIPRRKFL